MDACRSVRAGPFYRQNSVVGEKEMRSCYRVSII